ncbi:AP-1 adaptor complex mu subunit Apm1 [Balamuthia mandrillaris]
MASAVFILDLKGKVLMSRDYRGDTSSNVADRFMTLLLKEEDINVKPIFYDDGINYIYVKYKNVYILAVTKKNVDATMILFFLHRLVKVFCAYFEDVEEESIRDNFVIIYELLDEMMDFGYPQLSDASVLKDFITQDFYKLEVEPQAISTRLTGKVQHRAPGIRYRKNEVFLDVVESLNVLVAANGTVLNSEIVGKIKVKCFLSGMPELRLGFNDRVQFERKMSLKKKNAIELEGVTFHQCVGLTRFESDRTISFVPPDGEFELMSYRLNTRARPLIWVEAIVESHKGSRVEYLVKVRSQFNPRLTANNVAIFVPVPPDADSPKLRTNSLWTGQVKYVPERNAILWFIPKFQGGREFLMRAHFGLPSTTSEEQVEARPPITVRFEIPYFCLSGLQVRYLKIFEKSGYQALPWVRYITQSGDYQLRLS